MIELAYKEIEFRIVEYEINLTSNTLENDFI